MPCDGTGSIERFAQRIDLCVDGAGILSVDVRQIHLQVHQRLLRVAADGMGQATVAPLAPRPWQQHHQAVLHRQQAWSVLLRLVHFFQVVQQPRHDFARCGRLQVARQRRVVVAGIAFAQIGL